jgi:hypothetical protein
MPVTITKPSHGDLNWDGPLGTILDLLASVSPPTVTGADDGKYLGVSGGVWGLATLPATSVLPTVTSVDNGLVLGVVSGAWAKMSVPAGPPGTSGFIAQLTTPTGVPDGTVWVQG